MASILKKDLEADYRLSLSWRYDSVEFLGLPSMKENRPLTLEEIYVPLTFTREPVCDLDISACKRDKALIPP